MRLQNRDKINGNIVPQVRLIDRAVLEPPYIHRKRQPDEFILYVMKSGVLYLQEGDTKYTLTAGNVILLDPDFIHFGLEATNCEYYYIHFRHPQIKRRQDDGNMIKQCIKKRSASLIEDNGSYLRYHDAWIQYPKMIDLENGKTYIRIMELLEEAKELNVTQLENYKVYCGCCILEVLTEISRYMVTKAALHDKGKVSDSYHRVQALLHYLNLNYGKKIDSNLIELEFNCNFDYLNKVFKANMGKTIFLYLNEIRMHHAMELLSTTSMKISAVAHRVGYEDEGYFGKVFRKYTGVTPGQYGKVTYQLRQEEQSTDQDKSKCIAPRTVSARAARTVPRIRLKKPQKKMEQKAASEAGFLLLAPRV